MRSWISGYCLDFSQAENTPTALALFEPGKKYNARTFENSSRMKTRSTIFMSMC